MQGFLGWGKCKEAYCTRWSADVLMAHSDNELPWLASCTLCKMWRSQTHLDSGIQATKIWMMVFAARVLSGCQLREVPLVVMQRPAKSLPEMFWRVCTVTYITWLSIGDALRQFEYFHVFQSILYLWPSRIMIYSRLYGLFCTISLLIPLQCIHCKLRYYKRK